MAICSVAELGEPALALARPDLHPAGFVAQLVEKKLYPDAVRFLAQACRRKSGNTTRSLSGSSGMSAVVCGTR